MDGQREGGGRVGGTERGTEVGRYGGKGGVREKGMEGGREGWREGERDGGREGWKGGGCSIKSVCVLYIYAAQNSIMWTDSAHIVLQDKKIAALVCKRSQFRRYS